MIGFLLALQGGYVQSPLLIPTCLWCSRTRSQHSIKKTGL